jgi:hypothetical protein
MKTVEKSRSSMSPSRSRTRPMNQRSAIPAMGINPRPARTAHWREGLAATLASPPSARAYRIMSSATIISNTKPVPAIAAARRVRQRSRLRMREPLATAFDGTPRTPCADPSKRVIDRPGRPRGTYYS